VKRTQMSRPQVKSRSSVAANSKELVSSFKHKITSLLV
jgi:hypothetical protein